MSKIENSEEDLLRRIQHQIRTKGFAELHEKDFANHVTINRICQENFYNYLIDMDEEIVKITLNQGITGIQCPDC